MRRVMRALTLVVVCLGASGMVVGVSPASAQDLCQSVTVDGITGHHSTQDINPLCVPYTPPADCVTGTEGLSPTLLLTQTVCVPKP